MLSRLLHNAATADLATASARTLVEERYRSLREQVPIIYLLGLVNISAMEFAATGRLAPGLNLPTFIGACGVIRMWHWFGRGSGSRARLPKA